MDNFDADALAAKTDEDRLNHLICANRRFILACASQTARRYLTDADDEWSVALSAFTEAVEKYQPEKGSFRGFASMVIRRRLLDEQRVQARHGAEVSIEPYYLEDGPQAGEELPPLARQVRQKNAENALDQAQDPAAAAREEIQAMQQVLQAYGFSFFALAECSPKAEKTKQSCALAVAALVKTPGLLEKLRQTRKLPMQELCRQSGVPRKILERHRNYIIAAAEIVNGEYPVLGAYLSFIRKALDAS